MGQQHQHRRLTRTDGGCAPFSFSRARLPLVFSGDRRRAGARVVGLLLSACTLADADRWPVAGGSGRTYGRSIGNGIIAGHGALVPVWALALARVFHGPIDASAHSFPNKHRGALDRVHSRPAQHVRDPAVVVSCTAGTVPWLRCTSPISLLSDEMHGSSSVPFLSPTARTHIRSVQYSATLQKIARPELRSTTTRA